MQEKESRGGRICWPYSADLKTESNLINNLLEIRHGLIIEKTLRKS